MSKEIITKVNRERGYTYSIDRKGQVIKESYNWFKDKTTIVVIIIIILGGMYYLEMSKSATNAQNFDAYCSVYYLLREDFIRNNPNVTPTVEKVLEYSQNANLQDLNMMVGEDG